MSVKFSKEEIAWAQRVIDNAIYDHDARSIARKVLDSKPQLTLRERAYKIIYPTTTRYSNWLTEVTAIKDMSEYIFKYCPNVPRKLTHYDDGSVYVHINFDEVKYPAKNWGDALAYIIVEAENRGYLERVSLGNNDG